MMNMFAFPSIVVNCIFINEKFQSMQLLSQKCQCQCKESDVVCLRLRIFYCLNEFNNCITAGTFKGFGMAKHFITQKRTLYQISYIKTNTRYSLALYHVLRLRIMSLQSISNMMRNIQKVSFFQTKSRNRILTLVCRNKTKPEFSLSVDVVDQ